MNILQIDSSALGANSVSREITASVVRRLRQATPGAVVAYRDLAGSPLAHLDGELLAALRPQPGIASDGAQRDEVDLTDALIAEFLAADVVVVGAPMYNFSVPSQLKAWIDRLAQPGRTFRYTADGPVGLAGGKKVIVVSSRGGLYAGTAFETALDHQEAYLRAVFGFFGITDVEVIRAEGTALGDEARAASVKKALAEVCQVKAPQQEAGARPRLPDRWGLLARRAIVHERCSDREPCSRGAVAALPPSSPDDQLDRRMQMQASDLETVVVPRQSDLGGGFVVRRALPSVQRRTVGPYVFFDQMGPVALDPGHGLDVRPHPHIGLATVTYLYEGEIVHRDSVGSVQPIRPGEVNWMTAGRGIAHSERSGDDLRASGSRLSGIQVWVALPNAHEEAEPAFAHHGAAELPTLEDAGVHARLIVGTLAGERSPVEVFSEMFQADLQLDAGARFSLPAEHDERAAYVVDGRVTIGGAEVYEAGQLLVFGAGREIVLGASAGPARLMLFGGEPLDGPRHLWWNFVSSSSERIEQAKADWLAGRFAAVPGETEFIPLPDKPGKPAAPVAYP